MKMNNRHRQIEALIEASHFDGFEITWAAAERIIDKGYVKLEDVEIDHSKVIQILSDSWQAKLQDVKIVYNKIVKARPIKVKEEE